MADTGKRPKHVAGNDQGVKGLSISVGSTARTLVWTSPKPGYGSPKHTLQQSLALALDTVDSPFLCCIHMAVMTVHRCSHGPDQGSAELQYDITSGRLGTVPAAIVYRHMVRKPQPTLLHH